MRKMRYLDGVDWEVRGALISLFALDGEEES